MLVILLIGIGGALGSITRYALSGWVQDHAEATFPIGTMAVNVIGCFLIGLLGTALSGPLLVRPEYRMAVLVGFLGGMTTFSSFANETLQLALDAQPWRAGVNIVASNALCLIAVLLGHRLARAVWGV